MTDKPQTLDEKIAEARERFARFNGAFRYADPEIDVIVAACGAALAEKDAEIARLNGGLYESSERHLQQMSALSVAVEHWKRLAESRTVTDAQREQIEKVIRIITTCRRYQSEIVARRVCEILEEQPAAEGAP